MQHDTAQHDSANPQYALHPRRPFDEQTLIDVLRSKYGALHPVASWQRWRHNKPYFTMLKAVASWHREMTREANRAQADGALEDAEFYGYEVQRCNDWLASLGYDANGDEI